MRVLITGMSGTGKSAVIGELAARGFPAVELDSPEWSAWAPAEGNPTGAKPGYDWLWKEDRVAGLLAAAPRESGILFVSGCAPNMGKFLSQFDHVVLLTAPVETMVKRLEGRLNNTYGKRPEEVARVIENTRVIEPRLRLIANLVIDTSSSLEAVVDRLLQLVTAPEKCGTRGTL